MMTHILSNLPEEYQTILEIIEDKLDNDSDFITIERVRDKIFVKCERTIKKSRPKMSGEDENYLYIKYQYKGTCADYRTYRHKSKDCLHREGANVPTFNYSDKPGHVNKGFWKLKIVEYLPGKNVEIVMAIRDVT